MILIKDGIERVLTNKETIKIFKEAGWEEVDSKETIEIEKKQPEKRTRKKTK